MRGPAAAEREIPPWREPVRGGYPAARIAGLAGIEQLRSLLDGTTPQPPLSRLTGNVLAGVGDGETEFRMPLSGWLCSPQGAISVGPLALPADAAVSTAIQTRLPPGSPYSTSELSLRLLAPVRPGGAITARGRVIELRRTLTLSEVTLVDDAGRRVGHGSALCIVQAGAAARPPAPAPAATTGPEAAIPAVAGVQAGGPDPDPFARPPTGTVLGQEVWDRLGGLEVLRRLIAGELPPAPIERLTGLRPRAAGDGTATFTLPASEWLCAPPRERVQGGCVAMLAEAALMTALQTRLPAGTALAPVDLKVNFVRPLRADGRDALAHGRALHVGRRTGVASSEVRDADGRLVAIGNGSAVLLPRRAASLRR